MKWRIMLEVVGPDGIVGDTALNCDGARWHQSGDELRVRDNTVLISLPPYAPELNPVENV